MANITERQQEILSELNERLNSYSLIREFSLWIFIGLLFVIGAIIAIALGELLFTALIIGGGLLAEFIGFKVIDTKPYRKDIYLSICSLMDECLAQQTESNRKIGNSVISTVQVYNNNLELYRRFIKQFPEMKSFKLWYISSYRGN